LIALGGGLGVLAVKLVKRDAPARTQAAVAAAAPQPVAPAAAGGREPAASPASPPAAGPAGSSDLPAKSPPS
jgi:hypothetical protein